MHPEITSCGSNYPDSQAAFIVMSEQTPVNTGVGTGRRARRPLALRYGLRTRSQRHPGRCKVLCTAKHIHARSHCKYRTYGYHGLIPSLTNVFLGNWLITGLLG